MTIYLVQTYNGKLITKAFTDKQLAREFMIEANKALHSVMNEIELITDHFMEHILQPKESHEFSI